MDFHGQVVRAGDKIIPSNRRRILGFKQNVCLVELFPMNYFSDEQAPTYLSRFNKNITGEIN